MTIKTEDDWSLVKHFRPDEFFCKCGECERDTGVSFILVQIIDRMRRDMNFPFKITSGFRCPKHPQSKNMTSSHAIGLAVDIYCPSSNKRYNMMEYVFKRGMFSRVGVAHDFLHFDIDDSLNKSQRVMWTY